MRVCPLPDNQGIRQTAIKNDLHDGSLKKGKFVGRSEGLIHPDGILDCKRKFSWS
jgi:hypothetical protein